MSRALDAEEITRQLVPLSGWTGDSTGLRRAYTAPSFLGGVELVTDVAEVAEEMDHHPDIDIRWRTISFFLVTHSEGGVTQLDVELAHRIAALAAEHEPSDVARIEVCVDTVDREAVLHWWLTALDYVRVDEDGRDIVDPSGTGPAVWFQEVPEAKSVKNRLHLDVYVSADEAVRRRDELVALGGRWIDQGPDFWVLADPEGNELCLCWD